MKKFLMIFVLVATFLSLPIIQELASAGTRLEAIQDVLPGISEADVATVVQGNAGTWTRKDQVLLQALVATFPGLAKLYSREELKALVKAYPQRIQNAINSAAKRR